MDRFKSYYYFKPPVSDTPLHRLPDIKTNRMSFTEIWLRYPNDNEIYPMHAAESMVAQCGLRTLMHEICVVSFRANQAPMKMPWERALGFQAKLKIWHDTLPNVLDNQNLLYPSHLKVQ